jgi:hypothetical protein
MSTCYAIQNCKYDATKKGGSQLEKSILLQLEERVSLMVTSTKYT